MRLKLVFGALAVLSLWHLTVQAADNVSKPIIVDGREFASWTDFFLSDYFQENGKRCGTPAAPDVTLEKSAAEPPSDCSAGITNPSPAGDPYAPTRLCEIPTWVHILHLPDGTGNISDELVTSQIEVLNEDFQALPGSLGAPGTDLKVRFVLAGITRSENAFWFADQLDPANGTYYDNLAVDPNNNLNIYTNLPEGAGGVILGYVPWIPQQGSPGSNADRVVILYSSFGRNSDNPPYHLGRTATHEVGHWMGFYHTFDGGCASGGSPGCYSSGDRICDTPAQTESHGGCPVGTDDCAGDSGPDPIRNYMEYTNDICMTNFTLEQARRARCTLQYYRPQVCNAVTGVALNPSPRGRYLLGQNRPNPFNPTTDVTFDLARSSRVSLVIIDPNGRPVRTLADGVLSSGPHRIQWDGTNDANQKLASGVYFYRLDTDEGSETRRMILLR